MGLKIKFDDTAKEQKNPRTVIDTGGHKGQGFTVYLQSNKLNAEVSYNYKMWRVCSAGFLSVILMRTECFLLQLAV